MLGFQSYWDAAYADELANFREHGHTGEVWYGLARRQLATFSLFLDPLYYCVILVLLIVNQLFILHLK